MNLDNITRDDWILGGLALLLIVALLFFPWFDISVGPFSATFAATGAPDGWLGILALLAALALIADLAVERLSPHTKVPEIGGGRTSTRFILAAIAAAFVALKFIFHIHFSLFGWGFYATVLITAALVFFALQARGGAPLGAGITGRGGAGGRTPGASAGGSGSGSGLPGAPGPGAPGPAGPGGPGTGAPVGPGAADPGAQPPPASPPGAPGPGGSTPPPGV